MTRFRIRGGRPLRGATRVPGDKSISHRSLLFAALAEGRSTITGFGAGADPLRTMAVLSDMGVRFRREDTTVEVDGVSLDGLRMPPGALDCGNSGTTMRLTAGLLVGQRFGTRLVGDESLSRRPMKRIVEPLRARGGHIAGTRGEGDRIVAPLSVAPLIEGEALLPIEMTSPVASAQVKSAVLLSGLYCPGITAVQEPTLSRDHTERMMSALGVPLQRSGALHLLDPTGWDRRWDGFQLEVPGDLSSAAFLLAAALVVPGSAVRVNRVGLNPTRTGLLDVLRSMRAPLGFEPRGDTASDEPIGDIIAHHGALGPGRIGGELLTRMIDEVPAFAAVATVSGGRSEVHDAAELRVKESDRIAETVRILAAFGADVTEVQDGFLVHGGASLRPATVDSAGDHRLAMLATVLALAAPGESVVEDAGWAGVSFPGFVDTLRGLGADVEEEESE